MEPIKASWENWPGTLLTGFPAALPDEYGRSLPGMPRNLKIFWVPQEERNSLKSIGSASKV